MSTMSSVLENEDLENVALVRMEDVQPSRDRIDRAIAMSTPVNHEEVFGICVIDKVAYDCTIGDDSDSNIGSMVSIKSEEVVEEGAEYSDNEELIVPEVLDPPRVINVPITQKPKKIEIEQTRPETWPTLEILPGGVIKNAIDWDSESINCSSEEPNTKPGHKEMSYACAKCSQTFKYLFCLVKHVKLHEAESKVQYDPLMTLNHHPSSLAPESSGTTVCSCSKTDVKKVAGAKKLSLKTYKNKRKLLKRLQSEVI